MRIEIYPVENRRSYILELVVMSQERCQRLAVGLLVTVLLLGVETECFSQAAQKQASLEAFQTRDSDGDGKLTEDEFVAGGDKPILHRDFLVFDADHDGRLTAAEFSSVPALNPENQRTALQDPILALTKKSLASVMNLWPDGDKDGDGILSAEEFVTSKINDSIPGLRLTRHEDWDVNHDGKFTKEEAGLLLDIAFGLRTPTGESLKSDSGQVLDWRMFRGMDPDASGKVPREKYLRTMGTVEAAEKWFPTINAEGNERFGVTEFFKSGHRTDPVTVFLNMDRDLDGRLTAKEMESLPAGWAPPGRSWLAGFDDDQDQAYSLREFCLLPHVNLLASWDSAQDGNQDGKLSLDEFRFVPPPSLAALSAEYFRRLDRDGDEFLSLKEWAFQTSHPDARFQALDLDGNGELSEVEFMTDTSLPANRLRRDFRVFDADGDGLMTQVEFLTIADWIPESHRTQIADPIVALSQAGFSSLTKEWDQWDRDKDGWLSADEFAVSPIGRRIRGLEASKFENWDINHDGKLSKDEAARVVDYAFGVAVLTGERLRSKSGYVWDWRGFRGLDPDGNGRVTREDYMRMMAGVPMPEEWYRRIAKDDAADFGIAEFVKCPYHTDPVKMFLGMDADLDGRVTRQELTGVPADWGPSSKVWLEGFDDDRDGAYSLREFMMIPHVNLLASWHGAQDRNQDGKLSLDEFQFAPMPALAALSAEYFRKLDINHDGSLTLDEWPFHTSHAESRFTVLDTDADGELIEAEFTAEGSLPAERLRRDFKVFDHDHNGRMTRTEFLTIPHWIPENQRTPIPDPVVLLSAEKLSILENQWKQWDQDSNGSLSKREFEAAAFTRPIPGLEASVFSDWDQDRDGQLTREEATLLLDIAFGVRAAGNALLRSTSGNVVDWGFFRALDPDGNGRVSREEYMQRMTHVPNADEWYRAIAKDGASTFGIAEFVNGNHRTAPVSYFLELDVNLDGRLSPEELKPIPWGPPTKKWLPGFDDDGDGAYSLGEFLLLPNLNVVTAWHAAQDVDDDGLLSLKEFNFAPAPALAALSAEYFRRLDVNHDRSLSLGEWSFQTNNAVAKYAAMDSDGDGVLTEDEFIAEGNLPVERLRRDFKLFDVDENGRIEQSEFMAIPHWVSAGQRTSMPDPVVVLSQASLSKLTTRWGEWDKDSDGSLDATEFKSAGLGRQVRGLEITGFDDWDSNHDGKLSKDEAALLLDIAFGVRAPTGEPLRSKAGHVVDWRGFLGLNPDKNGKVRRETYIKSMGPSIKPEDWFPTIHATQNELFGVAEFLTSNHKTDPISQFLGMDIDLNGKLSREEMDAIPQGWGPPGKNWLAGFDDDGDGSYSLNEFRLIPHVNLLTTWHAVQDKNHDGRIGPIEFRFMKAPALAALSAEYFRRLDANKDGFLGVKEWTFSFDPARVPRSIVLQSRDRDGDNQLSFDEVLGDLRRPTTGPADPGLETTLVRIEEAFRRADSNKDGFLDQIEMASDDGLEAIAPGALVRSKSTVTPPTVPIADALGMDVESVRTYAIIEFNILLVVGVGIYAYRKRKAAS